MCIKEPEDQPSGPRDFQMRRPQPNKLIAQDSAVSNPCYIPVTNYCPRPPIFARSIGHPEHPSEDCSPFYEPPRDQECPANKAGSRGKFVAGAVSKQHGKQRQSSPITGVKSFRHQNLSPCDGGGYDRLFSASQAGRRRFGVILPLLAAAHEAEATSPLPRCEAQRVPEATGTLGSRRAEFQICCVA